MTLHPHVFMHFTLLEQIRDTKDPQIKKMLCLQDIALLPEFRKEWAIQYEEKAEHSFMMGHLIGEDYPLDHYREKFAHERNIPNFSSFKTLAIIYEKEGDYQSAIEICQDAIKEGFEKDGTKGGMTARIEKLKKKMNE